MAGRHARNDPTASDTGTPGLLDRFPVIRNLPEIVLNEVLSSSATVHFPQGQRPVRPGDPCGTCWLVVDGELRVSAVSRSGRELTLYRVQPGQMCALTSLCLFTGQPFPAHIEVVSDTVAIGVPRAQFQTLMATQEEWRRFAFETTWERLDDLLTLIDGVVLADLPTRLAGALLTAQEAGVVHQTHHSLASEIGSSREVVSRLLKRWENEGLVTLARGRIRIDAPDALRDQAQR